VSGTPTTAAAPAAAPYISQQRWNVLHPAGGTSETSTNDRTYGTFAAQQAAKLHRTAGQQSLEWWQYEHPDATAVQNQQSYIHKYLPTYSNPTPAPTGDLTPQQIQDARVKAAYAAQDAANPGLASVQNYASLDPATQQQIGQLQQTLQQQVGTMGTTYDPNTGLSTIPQAPQNMGAFGSMIATDPSTGTTYLVDANGNPIDTQDRGVLGQTWAAAQQALQAQEIQAKTNEGISQRNLANADASGGRLFSGMDALSGQQNIANYTTTHAGLAGQSLAATNDYATGAMNAQDSYNQQEGQLSDAAITAAMDARNANATQYLTGTTTSTGATTDAQANSAARQAQAATAAAATAPKSYTLAQWNALHKGETAKQNKASYSHLSAAQRRLK